MRMFETIVRLLVIASLSSVSFAEDKKPEDNGKWGKPYDQWSKDCLSKTPTTDSEKKKCETLDKIFASGGEDCNSKKADLSHTKSDFMNACDESVHLTDEKECVTKKDSCKCLKSSNKSDPLCAELSTDDGDSNSRRSRRSSGDGIDIEKLKKKLDFCPSSVAKTMDPDRLDRKLDRIERDIDRKAEELPKLQEQATNAAANGNNKLDDLRSQDAQNLDTYQNDLEKAEATKAEGLNGVKTTLTNIQQQIMEQERQIGQFKLSQHDAATKRNENKIQADLSCNDYATNIVSKIQADALTRLQEGRLNYGGENDMFRRVGLTSDTEYDKLALKYYNKCRIGDKTRAAKQQADDVFNSEMSRLNDAIDNATKQKMALQQAMLQAQDPSAMCNQAGQTTNPMTTDANCQVLQQYSRNVNRSYMKYLAKRQQLEASIQKEATKGEQERFNKENALTRATQNLRRLEAKRDKLQSAIDLTSQYGYQAESSKKFNENYGKYISKVRETQYACCQSSSTDAICGQIKQTLEWAGEKAADLANDSTTKQITAADPQATSKNSGTSGKAKAPTPSSGTEGGASK